MHAAADLSYSEEAGLRKLSHKDIDAVFIRTQNLRWLLVDEVSMLPSGLLADFEQKLRQAVRSSSIYAKRRCGVQRLFGGYNMLHFGDWWQLPPIPDSAALFRPPEPGLRQGVKDVLNVFWSRGEDSLTHLWELTELKRCDDGWYNDFLYAARAPVTYTCNEQGGGEF